MSHPRIVAALVAGFAGLLAPPGFSQATAPPLLRAVATSPRFFNPALKQQATIRFTLAAASRVAVAILDRDRNAVRHFPAAPMPAGESVIRWDGTDDAGAALPDEAYTVRIDATGGAFRMTYDPAEHFTPLIEQPAVRSYSRADGVLSYTLARPARVHVQAGQASRDPRTGAMDGPVLKTVVDRQPRAAGSVIEIWHGMDETGTIYVPALPHFAVAILATSLPDNAIILAGGAGPSFVAYARAHRPAAALRPRALHSAAAPAHHEGLTGLEDRSPRLDLRLDGTWDRQRRVWRVPARVTARVAVGADQAPYFLGQPQSLTAYLDERAVLHIDRPANPQRIRLPGRLAPGEHRLVVNWSSALGPVGLSAARIVAR